MLRELPVERSRQRAGTPPTERLQKRARTGLAGTAAGTGADRVGRNRRRNGRGQDRQEPPQKRAETGLTETAIRPRECSKVLLRRQKARMTYHEDRM